MFINTEPFQRTDISLQPLEFNLQLYRVQILNVFLPSPSGPAFLNNTVAKDIFRFYSSVEIILERTAPKLSSRNLLHSGTNPTELLRSAESKRLLGKKPNSGKHLRCIR